MVGITIEIGETDDLARDRMKGTVGGIAIDGVTVLEVRSEEVVVTETTEGTTTALGDGLGREARSVTTDEDRPRHRLVLGAWRKATAAGHHRLPTTGRTG